MNGIQAILTALFSGLINAALSGKKSKSRSEKTLRELRKENNRWHRAMKNRSVPQYRDLTNFDNFPLGKEPSKKETDGTSS